MPSTTFNKLLFYLFLFCFAIACSTKRSASTSSKKPTPPRSSTITKKPSSTTKKPTSTAEAKTRQLLIKEAEKHKGTPYKYAGKDPKGFDCSGFTYYVYGKHNIQLSGSSGAQAKQGKEIPVAKAKTGDLLFFGREGREGRIQHVGLVYKNNAEGLYMIHSSSKRGIVIDNVTTSSYWKPKLLFARRVLSN
jgi:cell wall-associated NlpC family hydrolase